MDKAAANGLINFAAALLSLIISTATIIVFGYCAFAISKPDGTTTLLEVIFTPQVGGVYLLLTLFNAALGACLWRAAAGWLAVIAAGPCLLVAVLWLNVVSLGLALLTSGVQYATVRLHRLDS